MKTLREIDAFEAFKHIIFALLMGATGAVASVLMVLAVTGSFSLFAAHRWLLFLLPLLGAGTLLLYRTWNLPMDLTTKMVVSKIRNDKPISPALSPAILVGTCATMLGGGSVGNEATALQMGASLGSLIAKPFKLKTIEKREKDKECNLGASYSAAIGMAATFSALFFAPLGATALVLELSRFKKTLLKASPAILLACVVAWLLAKWVGIGDVIPKIPLPEFSLHLVGLTLLVGLLGSAIGALFSAVTRLTQEVTGHFSKNFIMWVVIGGVLYVILMQACNWFDFAGPGTAEFAQALQGQADTWAFAIKVLLTVICLGFWFKGGEIMPSFCIGALLGVSTTLLTGGDACYAAALGSIIVFSSFSGCPLAGFFLGCELFGWSLAPMLAIAFAVEILVSPTIGMYGAGLKTTMIGWVQKRAHKQ